MLLHQRVLSQYDKKDLVYIPVGAEKGDCPYCDRGVLFRDKHLEKENNIRECYVCPECGTLYREVGARRFFKFSVNKRYSNN